MKDILKSNKITGLVSLKNFGVNVPDFNFIEDFSDLAVDYCALNYRHKIPVVYNSIENALTTIAKSKSGYSLRSASFDEDDAQKSAAGRYLSFNGLKTIEELYWAAITIWKNHRNLSTPGIKCPLILQATHSSYFSGVLFREYREDKEVLIIESYYGSCRTIVNGMGIPYRTQYINGKWIHNFCEDKRFCHRFYANESLFINNEKLLSPGSILKTEYYPFPKNIRKYVDNKNNEIEVYGYRIAEIPQWYEEVCNKLLNLAQQIDDGNGVDLEWGTDFDGTLHFYQFRPLTRTIIFDETEHEIDKNLSEDMLPSNIKLIRGLPGSPGIIEGIVSDIPKDTDSILMLTQATVDDVSMIESSAGVISAMGGILSHLAIVCRELNKPCVLGIQTMIPNNSSVEINGSSGIIKILS